MTGLNAIKRWSCSDGTGAGYYDPQEDPDGVWVRVEDVEAALKDAARYRWLRADNAYKPEEDFARGGEALDKLCDEGIAESGRVITRVMDDGIKTRDGAA